ncbi:MAG: hypothetical protein FWD34_09830 [Oscillospiraceae bacterium]|nr:hypothetical protein [Oscillospiraceae bacterium]
MMNDEFLWQLEENGVYFEGNVWYSTTGESKIPKSITIDNRLDRKTRKILNHLYENAQEDCDNIFKDDGMVINLVHEDMCRKIGLSSECYSLCLYQLYYLNYITPLNSIREQRKSDWFLINKYPNTDKTKDCGVGYSLLC